MSCLRLGLILYILLGIVVGFTFAACQSEVPEQPTTTVHSKQETEVSDIIHSLTVLDVNLNRSYYRPGESVQVVVNIESQVEQPTPINYYYAVSHLADLVYSSGETIKLSGGPQTLQFDYQPPSEVPRGYGLDVCLKDDSGKNLVCRSTAFDVLNNWTDTPRYGFLTDFEPGRSDVRALMDDLTSYHLNGLQFYDWMYRHEQFITDQEPYQDPLGRLLSRSTVESLISAAHDHNIAAMPYTAIYAASVPFYEQHSDWAIFKSNGQPYMLGEDFLVYMDPRPGSSWVVHLLSQFDEVLRMTDFDGIHLDQYGDPKEAYDAQGNKFHLAEPLAATINKTKELVLQHRSKGAVVFNAVANWPIENVAPANQDLVYIEVWPPYTWFSDLHALITRAQDLGNGKPVVLAAYISPANEPNVRIVDAIIFGSGGGHIEIGERDGMLADPYFPRYEPMSTEMTAIMRRYYDFAIRYQDVIGPRTEDSTHTYQNRILLDGISSAPNLQKNKVWPIVRESDQFTAINLINLLDLDSPEWGKSIEEPPTPLGEIRVQVFDIEKEISRVWLASPDHEDLRPTEIPYTLTQESVSQTLSFDIPYLFYWDLIVFEWSS